MKDFRIRRGQESDTMTINRYIVEWLGLDIDRTEEKKREDEIRKAIGKKQLLVAVHEGKPIGFIHYVMHEDIVDGGANTFITAFYVAAQYRGRGVGSKLLTATIRDSLEKGVRGVEVSTANPYARRLYEKHHFEQYMGDWTMGEVFLELNVKKYLQDLK